MAIRILETIPLGINSVEHLLEHVMGDVIIPNPSSESFSDEVVLWRKGWETKLNTLENVIQHLPKFSENEKAWSLLTGKYKFTAWFSLGLALFFDLCSLMAGLFRFWIQKKEVPKS